MNSVFLHDMKRLSDSHKKDVNLFDYKVRQGTFYSNEIVGLDSIDNKDSYHNGYHCIEYSFKLSDNEISAVNNITFSFETPQLVSERPIAYVPHFGYKLIQKVEVYDHDTCLLHVDGSTLFSRAHAMLSDLSSSGYSKELNEFTLSFKETLNNTKEYELPHTTITTPIFLFPDDSMKTYANIKNHLDSKLKIVVTVIKNVKEVMVYEIDSKIRFPQHKEPTEEISIVRPGLSVMCFAYQRDEMVEGDSSAFFIDTYEIRELTKTNEISVGEIDNITSINFSVGNNLSGKRFMCWAGYDQSETHWKQIYLHKLLNHCIYILEDEIHPHTLDGVSPKAEFIKVVDEHINFGNIKTIDIYIERVPKNHTIWFQTNPLVFKLSKDSKPYNILEKINRIHAVWNTTRESLTILETNDAITIEDMSVPISIWDVDSSGNEGDNRPLASKQTDVIINDPMLRGIDLLNKRNVFDFMDIKHGNETIYKTDRDVLLYNQNTTRLAFPLQCLPYQGLAFNHHDDFGLIPNCHYSDHSRGRSNITLRFFWKHENPQEPHSHIIKSPILQYGTLSNISKKNAKNHKIVATLSTNERE